MWARISISSQLDSYQVNRMNEGKKERPSNGEWSSRTATIIETLNGELREQEAAKIAFGALAKFDYKGDTRS